MNTGENKNMSPRITVFMPVYNGEKHLKEAMDSILHQTYSDFEFLIINDASTDNSLQIMQSYNDSRIRIVNNEKNLKIAGTRNRGLDLAKGEFIVMMDCDDISFLDRLEKQVKFMDENPQIGICGTSYQHFGENIKNEVLSVLTEPNLVKSMLFFVCAITNPSCIIRKKFIDKFNLKFDEKLKMMGEDHDLFFRSSLHFEVTNMPDLLLKYRKHLSSTTGENHDLIKTFYLNFYEKNLKLFDVELDDKNREFYNSIYNLSFAPTKELLYNAEKCFIELKKLNSAKKVFDEKTFNNVISQRWFHLCYYKATKLGLITCFRYLNSSLSKGINLESKQIIKFIGRCFLKKADIC